MDSWIVAIVVFIIVLVICYVLAIAACPITFKEDRKNMILYYKELESYRKMLKKEIDQSKEDMDE